jgi:glycosyltransferase involved in cell wall biosynthesis
MKPKSQPPVKAPPTPPRILIYRSELLAYSETFIAAQASALRTSTPILAGLRRVRHSLDLPCQSFVVAEGDGLVQRALRYAFLQTGHAPRLVADLRAQQPALLHAHFAIDAAEALPLARALAIPLIVTLHGYDVMANDEAHSASRRGRVYLARRQRLFREASLFLCVSDAIRQKAITRGFPPHKLRVHAIGIDVARFQPAGRLPAAPDILFVGRLVEKKGCAHLIHAMCEVRRVLPQARMIVVGDGPERSRLEAEAHRYGSQAIFLGVQSSEQVRQWMASSRVLAVPSITARDGDAEGLPTVLYEALAMGLPVACFRTSGIPELVRDGVEGLLADEADESALALNLLRLCQDDALAQRMSNAGRRRVEQSFDLAAQTAQLEAIYAELAESRYQPLHASGEARANSLLVEAPPKPVTLSASPQVAGSGPPPVLIPNSWKDHEHASHTPS